MSDEKNKKDIEIVEGIGNLDISPVYDDLSVNRPTMQDEKPKNIVVPKVKKDVEKKKNEEDEKADDTDSQENE